MAFPFQSKRNISQGSAAWMTLREACRANLFHPKKDGFLIGDWLGTDWTTGVTRQPVGWLQRQTILPLYADLESNILTLGLPGSGKGSSSIIVNALRWNRLILSEPNGEGAAITLKHCRDAGYYLQVVNPCGLHREPPYLCPSHGFNIIAMLDPDLPEFGGLCHWLGGLVVERTGNEHDPFWVNKPEGISATLIMFIRLAESLEDQNLVTFRRYIMADTNGWKALVQKMKDWSAREENQKRYGGVAEIILNRANEISRELSVENNRTWASVLSSMESFTRWLDIPDVIDCVRRNDIDWERFKTEEKAALIYMVSGNFAKAYSGFGRMFVAACVMAMRQEPLAKSRALMILDEFPTLRFPDNEIETILATMRKYRLSIQIVVQELAQINNIGKIEGSCQIRQYLAANDYQTAKHVPDLCGVATVETETINGDRVTKHYTHRLLITPDEVLRLHKDKQIVFTGAAPPVLARLRPYWERPLMHGRYYPNPFHKGKNPGLKLSLPFGLVTGAVLRVASWFLGPSKTVMALAALAVFAGLSSAGVRVEVQKQGASCAYQMLTGKQWWNFTGETCGRIKIGSKFYG